LTAGERRPYTCPTSAAVEVSGAEAADMTHLLIRLAVSTGAVLLAQWVSQHFDLNLITVNDWVVAVIFAIVLGILNAIVRPILLLVTCPLNLITLGLFTFVVNAVVFWLAATLVPGIAVNGFVGALFGSLVVTLCTHLVDRFFEEQPASF
jgi:putative membrane protein